MATKYTTYTTSAGQRICDIAIACYGDPERLDYIYEDNKSVKMKELIPAGTVLRVRIIDEVKSDITENQLPPWKRQ